MPINCAALFGAKKACFWRLKQKTDSVSGMLGVLCARDYAHKINMATKF